MTETKTIAGWLIVDWKQGSHRTRQSEPSAAELGANELLADLKVNVTVPEVDVPTLAVDIDVPEPQVYAATLDALDEDDLPDWTDAATDVVTARRDDIQAAAPTGEDQVGHWDDLLGSLTLQAVQDAPGRPEVNRVREYVDRLARRVLEGHDPADPATEATGGEGR